MNNMSENLGENTSRDMNLKSMLFIEAVEEVCGAPLKNFSHNFTFESLKMELDPGMKRPTKEAVESLYNKKLKEIPFIHLRRVRDRLLAESDRYATTDFPHATAGKAEQWKVYRQSLRDLPQNTNDPSMVSWPEMPK